MRHPDLLGDLLALAGQLRAAGLDVHTGRVLDAIEALRHIDLAQRDEVYHTLRTLFVHRHDDFATFDRVFAEFFDGTKPRQPANPASGATAAIGGLEVAPLAGDAGDDAMPAAVAVRTWSDTERIASKDFASLSTAELAKARAAIERLTWTPGEKRTRRWTAGRGPQIDLRRAWSRSLRTGGDIISLPRRRRHRRPRTLVLLCDVSGSMERYSRMLLHFAHSLGKRHRVEAFLFSTRLTRVTSELRARDLDNAATAVSKAVPDWSGGTRIGEALRQFHQRWRRRALHGGPVVLLISDGWDRGEPALLRDQVARLQRSCHRLVGLNRLIGTSDYAPLTRGLQAALPYVDDFLPARTLTTLADLAEHLNALD